MLRRVHHAGIVVESLAGAYGFYRDTLGLPLLAEAEIRDQGVRAALLAAGPSEVELLEPLRADTGVGRFLARRGEGLHHVCFDTPDIGAALADLRRRAVELIDATPRPGLAGQIAFLHPRACAGILVELATPPPAAPHGPPAPYRLATVVIGSRDPNATAAVLSSVLGLTAAGTRLVAGPSVIEVVLPGAAGGEGLRALGFETPDRRALLELAGRAGIASRPPGDDIVVEQIAHGAQHRFRYRGP